ncbi:MAG: hypothetical protein IRZ16_22195 [Myxococcaceae bacterium]|nr:hypothetical protein [Myxococcaceae bacterium]
MRRLIFLAVSGLVAGVVGGCGALDGIAGDPDGGTGNNNNGGGGGGWRKFEAPLSYQTNSAYAYGVYCESADKCVVAASNGSDRGGGVYALGPNGWGELLVDGDYEDGPIGSMSGSAGDHAFLGFVPTRTGLLARVTTSGVIVIAQGDITQKSSWSVVKTGTVGGESFGGNATLTLQSTSDSDWVFVNNNGYVFSATQAPGPDTSWTRIWGPTAVPPVPSDFVQQFTADKTLCDWDISTTAQPFPSQSFYASKDLAVMIHPAYGLNQNSWRELNNKIGEFGELKAGLCISTDKGRHFYFKELPESDQDRSSPGPFGVTCLDNDTCFAFNGTQSQPTSYIYFSTDASKGKDSTWTKATIPEGFATSTDITISAIFFAPDKVHGWAVGNRLRKPLLLRTTDAGRTWSDISGQVASLADSDLVGGFALDKDHIWITGRYGFVGATDSAQK